MGHIGLEPNRAYASKVRSGRICLNSQPMNTSIYPYLIIAKVKKKSQLYASLPHPWKKKTDTL